MILISSSISSNESRCLVSSEGRNNISGSLMDSWIESAILGRLSPQCTKDILAASILNIVFGKFSFPDLPACMSLNPCISTELVIKVPGTLSIEEVSSRT